MTYIIRSASTASNIKENILIRIFKTALESTNSTTSSSISLLLVRANLMIESYFFFIL